MKEPQKGPEAQPARGATSGIGPGEGRTVTGGGSQTESESPTYGPDRRPKQKKSAKKRRTKGSKLPTKVPPPRGSCYKKHPRLGPWKMGGDTGEEGL